MFPTHPPSDDNSQGPQIFSQLPPLTNPNACYRPSPLYNIDTPNSEPESPIGLDGIQLDGSGYSSSSNTETPIEFDEYEIPTPTSRPIGQKATKRKAKGEETSNTNVVYFFGIENAIKEKNAYASRLIELKEAQERRLAYETIMKDTSNMNETQREAH
uniref:No apical meristem-associated C-terminal domain-containing protein n=1 Tax=Cajanus cajan TaxID=3821 RepID=A0A151U037_CAJCA|nr:hypothetical protein KK1_005274 [Cajanus cajan]